ncbi:hypothetical protein M3223_03930 [Paenibacillus pasadenensis]|uniref:hypothetical protein n=1 Tax=Paenibacillus pasadenensis TaxID=217090 RepID=UPI00203E9A7D|nr:hypothetical protein [Paenibacillus pasadenensis]MCM3746497.1 hypothetical protein [Paenibacillus pasadenensis]
MAQQFLDLRLSQALNSPTASVPLGTELLLVGDIGLQTVAAANTPMAATVKIMLTGTMAYMTEEQRDANVSVAIEKNGGETFGSGILVYSNLLMPGTLGSVTIFPISVSCADFPTVAEVNAGQIRYTLFISSPVPDGEDTSLIGPVAFNGIAVADS